MGFKLPIPQPEDPLESSINDYAMDDELGRVSNLIYSGEGSPEGVVPASMGSLYLNYSGGANLTLWVKESGGETVNGWVAK